MVFGLVRFFLGWLGDFWVVWVALKLVKWFLGCLGGFKIG